MRELEDGLPDSRANLTVDYVRGAWGLRARWSYYDSVYEHLFNCESCAISTDAIAVVDADLSRAFGKYTVSLGLRNAFDTYPDKHEFAGVAGYLGADYALNHPAGFNGGSYYLRLRADY